MNSQDPAQALPEDQCVLILNAEFFFSTLGERRRGMSTVDITNSSLSNEAEIVHLNIGYSRFAEIYQPEVWALGATQNTSATLAHRAQDQTTWSVVVPNDAFVTTFPEILRVQSQTLHGKMFFAYKSAKDRLHVWDGLTSTFRSAGLTAPAAAPTASDDAGAGTFSGTRIYRVRFIEQVGSVINRRSEPSAELTWNPPGTKIGVTVTRPALVNEGETHWELEASDGDGNFYVIATQPIATTTYDDQNNPATTYANFTLSPDVGDYQLIESVKYVKADQDRLVFGGSWTDATHGSRVAWTPVWKDPGFGNDERIPARFDDFIDLDWMDGGDLTGLSDPINGVFYAFKWSRIYKLQRTGRFDKAYDSFLISSARGAVYGSIVTGVDEFGKGCVYFLDPSIGPMRIGSQGLQHIQNLRGTWRTVNTRAKNIIAHGVYYPDKLQVRWFVATGSADLPNFGLCLQTNELRTTSAETTERGWAVFDGTMATAWCSTIVPENVVDELTGDSFLSFRPYLGFTAANGIQRADTGSTDNGATYRAIIRSHPWILAGLLDRWGIRTVALLASPNADKNVHVNVKLIRNYNIEHNLTTTDFTHSAFNNNEDYVLKTFDALAITNCRILQIEISDP